MATQIKNIVNFVNVPPGGTVALPHGLKISPPAGGELPQTPDHVTPNAGGFLITVDSINVTVTNTNPNPLSVDVLCEYWHTIERAFGAASVLQLNPRPFIEDAGGGAGGSDINVEDEGIYVGTRPTLNFIGTGVTAVDNPGQSRVDITIPGSDCEDCLSDGDPLTVTGPTNAPGVAPLGSRADHQHRLGLIVDDEGALVGAVPEIDFAGAGVSAALVGDKVVVTIPGAPPHDCEDCLATGAEPPTQIDIGDAQVVGVESLAARADHQHAFPAPPAPQTVTGAVNGTGAATTAARADHQHRLGLLVDDEGVVVGPGRPEINFIGAGVTAVDNPGLDRVDVTIPAGGPVGPPGPPGAGAVLGFGNQGVGAAAAGPGPGSPGPRWLDPWFGQLSPAGATAIAIAMPRAGTLRNLFVRHTNTGGGGVAVVTYEVFVNGVVTLLAVALATGVAGAQASDLVNSVVVAQGDYVSVRIQKPVGGGGILNTNVTMELA